VVRLTRRSCLFSASASLAALLVLPGRRAHAAERIKIRDLYKTQKEFSERALALANSEVEVPGFMAPPLKPDATFFVLTKMPMAVCPFCDNEADWPRDIVLVRLRERQDWVIFNRAIVTEGVLELGTEVDEETGFVSRVRLTDAVYETA
jgi:hypothetical protein